VDASGWGIGLIEPPSIPTHSGNVEKLVVAHS
jgi:hypothetical protein